MLYIVQFEDKPNVKEIRDKLFAAHLKFLDDNKDRVLVPGSVREIPSDKPLGGLWIIEAKDEAEALARVRHDAPGERVAVDQNLLHP